MAMTKKQRELSAAWFTAKETLDAAKAAELELRLKVVKEFFPNGLSKGVNNCPIDNGFVLKGTGTVNFKIDEAKVPVVLKMVKEKFKVNVDVFKTKIELKTGDYGKLPDDIKSVIDEALTITPGTPQLEIAKPKR